MTKDHTIARIIFAAVGIAIIASIALISSRKNLSPITSQDSVQHTKVSTGGVSLYTGILEVREDGAIQVQLNNQKGLAGFITSSSTSVVHISGAAGEGEKKMKLSDIPLKTRIIITTSNDSPPTYLAKKIIYK